MRPRVAFPLLAACFLASGAAGLLYQVVWMRLLALQLGSTTHAVTAVLAAFMGGLALGGAVAARRADAIRDPVRAYAVLEALAGLWALGTPWMLRAVGALDLRLVGGADPASFSAGLVHLGLAALVLVPPTALMGATLPVLGRAVVDAPGMAGGRVGALYALNTAGAVLGSAGAGFLLLPSIGLQATLLVGVALNFAVAAGSLALRLPSPPPAPATGTPPPWPLLVAVALSGAAAMADEVAWTRALGLVLGSSTYAFSAMLATMLVGLAGGAWIGSWLARTRGLGASAFGAVQLGVGLVSVVLVPVFGRLPDLVLDLLGRVGTTHEGALAVSFLVSALVLLPPCLGFGAAFPLAVQAATHEPGGVARDVGRLYSANTVGNIVGAVGAGLLLVPAIGLQHTLHLAAVANVLAGAVLLGRLAPAWVVVGGLTTVAAAFALPSWDNQRMVSGAAVYGHRYLQSGRDLAQDKTLLFYEEGVSTTVAVEKVGSTTALRVNGKTDASDGRDMVTQLLLGHLGALVHPDPKRALVIGLGSGVTAAAMARHPFDVIDVAELEPAVVRASALFAHVNRDVLADPRVHLHVDDGRRVLAAAGEGRWDIVVSEPSNPWIAGVGNLFTRELYTQAKAKLAPGGLFVQWLQGYALHEADLKMVLATFHESFPHTTMWRSMRGDYLLLGRLDDAPLASLDAQRQRFTRFVGTDFALFNLEAAEDVLSLLLLDEDAVARCAAGAPIHTDDLPWLEFNAPRALYASSAGTNHDALRACRGGTLPPLAAADLDTLRGPDARLRRAELYVAMQEVDDAVVELEGLTGPAAAVVRLAMGDAAGAEAALPGDAGVAQVVAAGLAPRLGSLGRGAHPFADPAAGFAKVGAVLAEEATKTGNPALHALAEAAAIEGLRWAPGAWQLEVARGSARLEQGDAAGAAEAYRLAAERAPSEAKVFYNLGLAEEKAGRPADAARAFAEAARLDPTWEAARLRAERLVRVGG